MIETNPQILVIAVNEIIIFLLNSTYVKLTRDVSKVHEQVENKRLGKVTSGKY